MPLVTSMYPRGISGTFSDLAKKASHWDFLQHSFGKIFQTLPDDSFSGECLFTPVLMTLTNFRRTFKGPLPLGQCRISEIRTCPVQYLERAERNQSALSNTLPSKYMCDFFFFNVLDLCFKYKIC